MSSAAPPFVACNTAGDVWQRYAQFLLRPPLLSIEWADSETDARGWLVINSLRGGAAGGGTRMHMDLSQREVVYLAKTMELKFLFSGPPIGGAKSGICFDPADPRKPQVLRRWFKAISPQLHRCYGTAGDLNVDEVLEVIPGCAEIGLLHPQEGVVRGHLGAGPAALPEIFHALDQGVQTRVKGSLGVTGSPLAVADLITGYGVARSLIRSFELQGRPIRGARVVMEGFGAVGGPCALYLARAGAQIVAISDREKTLLAPEGLGAAEVEALLAGRDGKLLPEGDRAYLRGAARARVRQIPARVFVCAASSGTLHEATLGELAGQGIDTIVCGANQPFRETALGDTRIQRLADERFTIIPDVIANCGRARAFSFLMQEQPLVEPDSIFRAVDDTISSALAAVWSANHGRAEGLLAATLDHALNELIPR